MILVAWPSRDCKSPALTISRRLDLNKDVVKTQAEMGSSTYLVTEEWAEAVLLDAARSGYQITVTK